MTSDIIQNLDAQDKITKNIFGFWGRTAEPESLNLTELLKTAYLKLKKAEQELHQKNKRIADLERILTIDELTGLNNRRGFYQSFESELDRVSRGQNQGGLLIMVDLDRFKAINDTYGHAAGDEALRVVGNFLKSNVRNMDCAARLGGDEFVLMLSNTSIAKAMDRARAIGQELNTLRFDWNGAEIKIFGSLGLQEFSKEDRIETIMALADAGMYDNKEERRKIAS